jgi:hypothetical protein
MRMIPATGLGRPSTTRVNRVNSIVRVNVDESVNALRRRVPCILKQ